MDDSFQPDAIFTLTQNIVPLNAKLLTSGSAPLTTNATLKSRVTEFFGFFLFFPRALTLTLLSLQKRNGCLPISSSGNALETHSVHNVGLSLKVDDAAAEDVCFAFAAGTLTYTDTHKSRLVIISNVLYHIDPFTLAETDGFYLCKKNEAVKGKKSCAIIT